MSSNKTDRAAYVANKVSPNMFSLSQISALCISFSLESNKSMIIRQLNKALNLKYKTSNDICVYKEG